MLSSWRCILCSGRNLSFGQASREATLCRKCGSTWRARSVALGVLSGLGYSPEPISRIKSDWSRIGIGISDDINVASRLSQVFHHSNTFFDGFPNLDLRNIPKGAEEKFEYVTCSDVLEHVDTKLSSAFKGLFDLLRPKGFAVISVPISNTHEHLEFYPNLRQFQIDNGRVKWSDAKGKQYIDSNPEFHGGRGQNLAFRRFSKTSLKEMVIEAGFNQVLEIVFNPQLGVPELISAGVFLAKK